MSWCAELWHLFRRDVQRTFWPLLVYVALLVLAVVKASPSVGALSSTPAPLGQAVLLLMPLLIALTVHADSAVRVDAFWAVQPVRTAVVVVSKLLYVLLLLALWAIAVSVVMSNWQLLSAGAAANIGLADMFVTFALLLLGTALVTAGCSRLASVGVVLGATIAVGVVLTFSTSFPWWAFTEREWSVIAVSMTVGAVLLLTHAYRVRASSRLIRGVTILGGAAVVLFATLTSDARAAELPSFAAPSASAGVVLRVPLAGQPECAQDRLTLPLEVTSPSAWRVELMYPRVEVSLLDGSHLKLSSDRWMQAAGVWGPMVPTADARIVGDSASTRVRRTDIVFTLPRGGGAQVCGNIVGVALRMPMRVASPREVLRLPLASSATVTTSGYRGRMLAADVTDTTVTMSVELAMLTSAAARGMTSLGELDYALSNPRQAQVVRLSADASYRTVRFTADGGGERNDANVAQSDDGGERLDRSAVPGLTITSSRLRLKPYDSDTKRPRDLRSWRDSAALVLLAPAWQPSEVRTVRSAVPKTSASIVAAPHH